MTDKKQEIEKEQEKDQQGVAKRAGLAIFMLVILLFLGVMFVSFFFELKFGKTAGTVALIVIAVIIAAALYWKEILAKIKKER